MSEIKNVNTKRSHFQLFIVLFVCFFTARSIYAQKADSLVKAKPAAQINPKQGDSVAPPHKQAVHSPAKAAVFSAILPGLGQAYNHKYWKIPIIYAGLGTMTYFIIYNQRKYNTYQSALKTRDNGGIDPYYNVYSTSDLVTLRDYYHRYRDLSVIGTAAFYLLNVIDAEVDAQMYTFDVSDDLSMRVAPGLSPYAFCGNISMVPSLSIVMSLK